VYVLHVHVQSTVHPTQQKIQKRILAFSRARQTAIVILEFGTLKADDIQTLARMERYKAMRALDGWVIP
jgi:hypothetical protein